MSVPERTGRARPGHGCRWCGSKAQTVKFEVRDPETGGVGSDVLCCICGKEQWRWGQEKKFWAREAHREIVRSVWLAAWFATHIIRLAGQAPTKPQQLNLFEAVTR